MRPRRALAALALAGATAILAAGCFGGGGDEAADVAPAGTAPAVVAAPVAVAAVPPGGTVAPGPNTPKDVARALAGSRVIVIAFLVKGPADDARVAASLRAVEASRTSRDVEFFTYRVGKDKFGDLADLLGVTGTPSIAVIGRDRVLANLWTGLTDAEILRQSISDAADTAAAHQGAAAADAAVEDTSAAPAAETPARKKGKGKGKATGDPQGIALATEVNASYADVAGIRMVGMMSDENLGEATLTADASLEGGIATSVTGAMTLQDTRIDAIEVGPKSYMRPEGAACWAAFPESDGSVGTPVIEMKGRFGKPVTGEGVIRLPVTDEDGPGTYVIDAATKRVTKVESPDGTYDVTVLDSVTPATVPAPVCADPLEAFDAMPSTLPVIQANAKAGCERSGAPASVCQCVTEKMSERFPTVGALRAFEARIAAKDQTVVAELAEMREQCPLP